MTNKMQNFKGAIMLQRAEELDSFGVYHTKKLTQDKPLLLLDNVQFIYELSLAQLELQSLGANFEVTNGLREFKLLMTKDEELLRKRLAYFKFVNSNYSKE